MVEGYTEVVESAVGSRTACVKPDSFCANYVRMAAV